MRIQKNGIQCQLLNVFKQKQWSAEKPHLLSMDLKIRNYVDVMQL